LPLGHNVACRAVLAVEKIATASRLLLALFSPIKW